MMLRLGTITKSIIASFFVILLILLALWYWDISLGIDNLDAGEVISFGQLLVDLTLLPTVIIGFAIATNEFRKLQENPKLSIVFINSAGITGTSIVLNPLTNNIIDFTLINDGDNILVWHSSSIEVPFTILGISKRATDSSKRHKSLSLKSLIVMPEQHIEHIHVHYSNNSVVVDFSSYGKIASFPEQNIHLFTMRLPKTNRVFINKDFIIPYKIITDRGRPIKGKLNIKFHNPFITVKLNDL